MPYLSPQTLTTDEQKLILLATAKHPRDHLIFSMALGTGLRQYSIDGKVIDVKRTRFGFRQWTWDSHMFTLNGVKWPMWADTNYTGSPQKSPSSRMLGAEHGYSDGTLMRSKVQGPIVATSSSTSTATRQTFLCSFIHIPLLPIPYISARLCVIPKKATWLVITPMKHFGS